MTVSVQIPADPPAGAIAPEAGAGTPVTTERPSWLPENFKTPEDLVKSYTEAQSALTRANQELAAFKKTPEQPPVTDPANPGDLKVTPAQVAQVQAMDFSKFSEEFATSGDVSEESRNALAEQLKSVFGDKARDVVDGYIEGQKVRTISYRNQVLEAVGGEQEFARMSQWAAANWSKEELTAYNDAVDSGDVGKAKLALRGLQAAYQAANGAAPQLIQGDGTITQVAGFASKYDMREAMSDPRYGKDPAYTREVELKTMMSNF